MTFRFDPGAPGATLAACEDAIAATYAVPEVTTDRLAELIDGGAVAVVDLRSAVEQAVSMIPSAVAIDETTSPEGVMAALRAHGLAGRPAVIYCAVGLRSARLLARWPRSAPTGSHLRGGIFRWYRDGRALAGGRRDVHPFNENWGRLLTSFE